MAGVPGFEPGIPRPKPGALPLGHTPKMQNEHSSMLFNAVVKILLPVRYFYPVRQNHPIDSVILLRFRSLVQRFQLAQINKHLFPLSVRDEID